MPRKQTHFINSLARGLSLLQVFSPEQPCLTLSQLAQITGLSLTAVQRVTDTLVSLGFLERNRHKEFFLGPKVLSLGFAYLNSSQLRRLAGEYIDRTAQRLGCTMNMAILDDLDIIFIHRYEIRRFLSFDLRAGSKLPARVTGSGKVLLATLEDAELKRRIARMDLTPVTALTIQNPDQLFQDLLATRQRGWSISDQEYSLDLYSLGTPILDDHGHVVAAVNLSMPTADSGLPVGQTRREELLSLGREISSLLGYSGPYPLIPVRPGQGDQA